MSEQPTPETDACISSTRGESIFDLCKKLERERDKTREKIANAIEGIIDGGSVSENYLMVQIPISPIGFKVGQSVQVILPMKGGAK